MVRHLVSIIRGCCSTRVLAESLSTFREERVTAAVEESETVHPHTSRTIKVAPECK